MFRKLQRVQAAIGAIHGAAPGHPQKIAELSRAATDLENRRSVTYLLIQELCENSAARLQPERFGGIEVIVIRKRRLFVERLHGVGNIRLIGGAGVLAKKGGDSAG